MLQSYKELIGLIILIGTAAIAVITSFLNIKIRQENSKEDNQILHDEVKNLTHSVGGLTLALEKLTVITDLSTKTLTSIITKQEDLEKRVNKVDTTVAVHDELLKYVTINKQNKVS